MVRLDVRVLVKLIVIKLFFTEPRLQWIVDLKVFEKVGERLVWRGVHPFAAFDEAGLVNGGKDGVGLV